MSRCIVRAGGAVLGYDTNPAVIASSRCATRGVGRGGRQNL